MMIDHTRKAPEQLDERPVRPATPDTDAHGPALDLHTLMRDLLDRAAGAQLALIQARRRGDRRGSDEALLQLRAATLLLASIPAPDPHARRFAVLAAALLASEDDDASSYARQMAEHAIVLGDTDGVWIDPPSAAGTSSDG